ncbi:hypothetical protein ACVW0P_004038 [Mucilaginibacter sp. UYNi724]
MIKTILRSGLFIAGLIAGLIFLETYFQLIEFQMPYFELSPIQGKKMLPSKRIVYFGEGFYMGTTNQYGYLGTPYPKKKDPKKIRIAMIGDSYVEGFQLFDKYHFARIAERKLNLGLPSPKYEVLNFGVGNYDFNDMMIAYMNYVKEFNPDVLVFLVKYDDFMSSNNFVPSPVIKPFKDSVIIDYSFTKSKIYKVYKKLSFAFDNSALVYAANNAYKISKRKDEIDGILFDKFYTSFRKPGAPPEGMSPSFEAEERFIRSFAWVKDKRCIFLFRSDIPKGLTEKANKMNIDVYNVDQALKKEFTPKGIEYDYWDVTREHGHWNYVAQDFVGDYIYKIILSERQKIEQSKR